MADEDDLYADLYADDAGGGGGDDDPSASSKGAVHDTKSGFAAAPAPAKSSFIPAAPVAHTSASNGGGSSFIPPAAQSMSKPPSSSFIPPSTNYNPSPVQQNVARTPIETAPMTNTDSNRSTIVSSVSAPTSRPILPHEMPDEGKLFVGGLNWDTTDDGLKQYFSQFGKVNHCLIMRDLNTGRSRGFAFLTFDDPKSVNSVMVKEHFLDGKMIDPKRAIPRAENAKTAKCFVGGIPMSATSESFKAFFAQFGPLMDCTLMLDRETGRPRGYGFVTYENDATVENLLRMDSIVMDGKMVEVKRATPRSNEMGNNRRAPGQQQYDSNPRQQRYGSYSNDGTGSGAGITGAAEMSSSTMGGNAAMANMMMNPMFSNAFSNQQFDPNAMAQFFQQQGGMFNPMMFQQMMMGAMGGVGGGGGGGGVSQQAYGNRTSHDANQEQDSRSYGAQNRQTDNDYGGGRSTSYNSLPARPSDDSGRSSGRDYQRERSPDRRGSAAGGNSRW